MSTPEERKARREYQQKWNQTSKKDALRLKSLSRRRLQPVDPERPESYVECTICHEKFRQITAGHLNLHDTTCKEYKALGHPLYCQEKLDRNTEVIRARSHELSGSNHPNWKGGHKSKDSGYRIVYHNGKRYPEHRFVMEQHLGRPLLTEEVVHHIDGNRANNVISNLVILTASEHSSITGKGNSAIWHRLGVITIRLLLEQGWTLYEISSAFHVTISTIQGTLGKYQDTLKDYTKH